MAAGNYSGYFLQGLGQGLQTGLNMGQQLQEMRWQKKQRKELEVKQAKMIEVSNIWNAKIKEAGADNIYSDEEIAQLSTIVLSGGYEFMEHYKGALDAIKSMNKSKYDQEKEWMDLFASGVEGLPSGDIQAMYEYIKPRITSEKGLNILEAYNNILQKRAKVAQDQPQPEVFTSPEAVLAKYPDSGYTYSANAGGYVPTFQKPTKEEAPPTELDIMGETQKKLDAAYATGNANYFNQMAKSLNVPTTFETYKQKYEKPGTGGVEKSRTTSLPQLEKYRDKALNADSWEDAEKIINDYTEAGYDATQLGVTKEAWADVKKSDLDNLVAVLNEITAGTPEGRNIKGKKKFAFEMDGESTEKTGEEWYKSVYESYIALLKLLEEQGIDTSQYKKLKPLSEIKKIKFGGFVGGGVETGDLTFIYY